MSLSMIRRSTLALSSFPWRRLPSRVSLESGRCHNASVAHSAELSSKLSRQKRKEVPADITNFVNDQIAKKEHGRLFAIIQLDNQQFKVTDGDIVVLQGSKRYDIGDEIKLEKVLCVGCRDFTLFGRPLISSDVVNIEATVVEKTLSSTEVKYFNVQRVAFHSLQFIRSNISLLRINRIELIGDVSVLK